MTAAQARRCASRLGRNLGTKVGDAALSTAKSAVTCVRVRRGAVSRARMIAREVAGATARAACGGAAGMHGTPFAWLPVVEKARGCRESAADTGQYLAPQQ